MDNTLLEDKLAALSPLQREKLLLKIRQYKGKSQSLSAKAQIKKSARGAQSPLSFSQQRLWFLDQYEGQNPSYNMPAMLRLEGVLNHEALIAAFRTMIARHEILRTRFCEFEGSGHQTVASSLEPALSFEDVSKTGADKATIQQKSSLFFEQVFDLSSLPLFRCLVLKLDENKHVMLLSFHHIIFDGWSVGIFSAELAHYYNSFCQGRAPSLPPLLIQYADYSHWQREILNDLRIEKELVFWKAYLADAPEMRIPFDFPPPQTLSHKGARLPVALSLSLSDELRRLCQNQGVTLYSALLAGFMVLCARYSAENDVVIGTPVANRGHAEIEPLIGFFVNTLAIRQKVLPEQSYFELQQALQRNLRDVWQHQALPFEKLVDELDVPRVKNSTPLFQQLFVWQGDDGLNVNLDGLDVFPELPALNTAKFDFTLTLSENAGRIVGELEYRTGCYQAETMARFAAHFQTLMGQLIAAPERQLAEISFLTMDDAALLESFNASNAIADWDETDVVTRFEKQVRVYPKRIAVSHGDDALSYEGLNQQANQLAHYLVEQGVQEREHIALVFERGTQLITAILAVLKCGASYVPVDPNSAAVRNAMILEDAQVALILSDRDFQHSALPCVDVSSTLLELANYSQANLAKKIPPNAPAYMIYTSGTTGKPKGVSINHENVTRLFSQSSDVFEFSHTDCWSLFHSYAFDFSVWEIWGALLFGGRLAIVPLEMTREPEQFYDFIAAQGITVLNQTPAAFNQLVSIDNEKEASNQALRYVIFGGEALDFPQLQPWVARYGYDQPKLINMYGITETTVHVTWHLISENDFLNPISNIGRPLADLSIYLLDELGQQVPLGVPGEMYVAGRGLSSGYWQLETLTAERFIHKTINGEKKRLYKSGDLAYYTPQGDLIYLGRNDEQVKIRGYRIELGEVTAQLTACQGVHESVVISDQAKKQLLAFVVFDNDTKEGSLAALRKELAEKLPQYMQPAFMYARENLPLTHNGKIDKKQLLLQHETILVQGATSSEQNNASPRSDAEALLVDIWQDVLGLEWVGVFDNFFELGGDSILSLQIISRAKKAGLSLSVKQLFAHQTISELAEVASTSSEIVVALQDALKGEVALNPIQSWFFDHCDNGNIKNSDYWNQSLIFKLRSSISYEQVVHAWEQILAKHDQLRCYFKLGSTGWVGHFKDSLDIRQLVFERQCEENKRGEVANGFEANLNIETGVLQQVVLLRCPGQDYLFVTAHHLLVDGVSWRIILDDFQSLLVAPQTNLGLKSSSFLEANKALQARIDQGECDEQIAYWSEQLLPSEGVFTENKKTGSTVLKGSDTRCLDRLHTRSLTQEALKNFNIEFNELLITGLLLSLQKINGAESFRIDLENHGRSTNDEKIDLSQTVGWFTALYPQRFIAPRHRAIGDYLISVKEQLRAAPEQGLVYGWLAKQNKCANLNASPAEVLFNYLGQVNQQSNDVLAWDETTHLQQIATNNAAIYPLEVNVSIRDDVLNIQCHYDAQRLCKKVVTEFLDAYVSLLQQLGSYCLEPTHFAYSKSDFPLLSLADETLADDTLYGVCHSLTRGDHSRELESLYPLSPMQEGMLFHALHDESGETYFEQMSIKIVGELNQTALQEAWALTLARHPILRTGFTWDGLPQALQFVRKSVDKPIRFYPRGGQPSLAVFLSSEREAGFDLGQAGLMRIAVLPAEVEGVYLVFNFHHLILDGWSVSLVLSDLFRFYRGLLAGEGFAPQVGPQYEPFIRYLSQEDPNEAEVFWRDYLGDFERATPLPYGDTHLSLNEKTASEGYQTGGYQTEVLCFSELNTQHLENFSKRHHLTLNTLFQAAWAYLLSRYAGDSTVVFGATVSGRPAHLPQVEHTAGMFINTLPVCVDVPAGVERDDAISIRQWLEKIQQQHVAMRHYESTSLRSLQQMCGLAGGESLFESIVVFENYPVDQALSAADMPFEVGAVEAVWKTNFPLTLIFVPGKQLTMKISYQEDRFSTANIQRLMAQLQQTLENFIEKAERPVQEINLLSQAERARMLQLWNQTVGPYPSESAMGVAFDVIVAKDPHHPAIWFENEVLSYQGLSQRANQLAHHLLAQGVGAETVVAYCGERSVDMLVSLLAIVKAGGAYLALDPGHPDERLQYMLEDSAAKWVMVSAKQRERFEGLLAADKPLPVIDSAVSYPDLPTQSPIVAIRPDQLALVIYTSGSTGQPKGIELTHRNVLRLVKNSNVVDFNPQVTLLHYAPIAFDAATWEIWGGLLNGAKLVVAPPGHLDPENFDRLIREQGISHAFLTTALFNTLAEFSPEAMSKLKVIMTGGEVANADRVRHLLRACPGLRFINLYGPSENTTLTTYFATENADDISLSVPIGVPVSNTQVYILDQNLQPVSVGMVGELCTAGDGVARGYRFKPALTAKVFVPNPFAKVHGHGSVLYRSGDMARYRADGTIEFLGRADQQVKIRGHRIELGEVEAALNQASAQLEHGTLHEVVVRAKEIGRGKHLVAWVVLNEASNLDALKEKVANSLPAYMVPSYWVCVDKLPLTPNGKVDHRALPEPEAERVHLAQSLPQSDMEKALAEIWENLLGVTQVGVNDNFFALGGDSILSIQVASRAKRVGIHISTKQLFENQSIAELVKVAGQVESLIAQQDALTTQVVLTPVQHWFYEQAFEQAQHWNMSLLLKPAMALRDDVSVQQAISNTEQAVQALVSQHDMLRAFYPDAEQRYLPLDWQHPQMQRIFSIETFTESDGDFAALLEKSLQGAQSSLDLETGPLFRVIWIQIGDAHRLLLLAHHLLIDGVSWRILLEDLALAMTQQAEGKAIDLGRKTTAFAHWGQRLWQFSQEASAQAQRPYWQTNNTRQTPLIQPDLLKPDQAVEKAVENLAGHTQSLSMALSVAQTEQLLREAPKAFQTEISDLLLTALVDTLNHIHQEQGHESKGQLIALESHGREHLGDQYDISRTLGWFTTLYPVFLQSVDNDDDWGAKIKATKQQVREIPLHGLTYGLLRYQQAHILETGDISDVNTDFKIGAEPQISFNYLGQTGGLFQAAQGFQVAQESPGEERSARSHQPYLIDVAGIIQSDEAGPQLQIMWRYSDQLFSADCIQRWAEHYQKNVIALIDYCLQAHHAGRVPADFPLLSLSQQQVDSVLPLAREIESLYPLAPLQEGLWFHHKLSAGEVSYFEQQVVTLEGDLNLPVLQEAWQQVVARHSIFRTAFVEVGDQAIQRLSKTVQVPVTHRLAKDISLEALLREDRTRGFDFKQPPLMRINVRSADNNQHDMVWSFHHILLDGWSVTLVLGELLQIYQQLAADFTLNLPPAPPYQEYIQWLSEQDEQAAREFWQQSLAGFHAPTSLPGEGRIETGKHMTQELKPTLTAVLPDALTDDLNAYAQAKQITLNTLFQGAWAYLLSAYSGEEDVVFGVTVAGRPAELSDIEQRVGLFINSLPLRAQLEGNAPISDWLQALQAHQIDARAYEYLPLFTIQSLSQVREELFKSLLVYENYPVDEALADSSATMKILGSQSVEETHYPMTVIVLPGKAFSVQITYDAQQFSAHQVKRLLSQLQHVLRQFIAQPLKEADPAPTLSSISLMQKDDLERIQQWNQTETPLSDTDTVLDLIQNRAVSLPVAVALDQAGEQLDYQTLNRNANQLAHFMLQQGLTKEGVVGIIAERGSLAVQAMLATLKAGGVILPIDPYYPPERISFMLQDAEVAFVLSTQDCIDRANWSESKTIINLDNNSDWALQSKENPGLHIAQNQWAYLMYTSGSTGNPKGVQVEHRSLLNFCIWAVDYEGLGPEDRQSVMAGFSFDASFLEIFPPLTAGASLHFVPEDIKLSPETHMAWMSENAITHAFMPTVMAEFFIQQAPTKTLRLRSLTTGGDRLTQRPHQGLPYALYNAYGPSEATVVTTIDRVSAYEKHSPTIGYPVHNTCVYVLDKMKRPVPMGVTGELYISGEGLARGYLNNPKITRERFTLVDIGANKKQRVYATGDLARYRETGELEFLGRIDLQIQVRGVRVELGEIEAQLIQLEGVNKAVVSLISQVPGENLQQEGLVAYLHTDNDIDSQELRRRLAVKLPEAMVPKIFQAVESLPVTANGKIDRKNLPPIVLPDAADTYVGPETQTEEKLVGIWQQVLGLDKISTRDDFFALGGHSLLATKVHNRLRDTFMLEIPLRTLFEVTTIKELAGVVQALTTPSDEGGEAMSDMDEGGFDEGSF